SEYDWHLESSIAIVCRSAGKVLHHEIGHIVIPVRKAEELDREIYGEMTQTRFHILKAQTTTPEQEHSFLPNCIHDWDVRDPQGATNAAEDSPTIVDNLQCGRREQVLALARSNEFVRKKLEKISQIYAERGYDVSSWRP